MADAKTCPVCGKKISGFLSTEPAGQKSIETLKQIGIDIDGLCLYCAQAKLEQEQQQRRDAYAPVADRIEELERIVPGMVIAQTTPHFESQQADVIGIVSGHSVIGTGPISSLASAFTDFFGKDSIAYQEKIRDAESKSMLMAKMQALDMGGLAHLGHEHLRLRSDIRSWDDHGQLRWHGDQDKRAVSSYS